MNIYIYYYGTIRLVGMLMAALDFVREYRPDKGVTI